MLGVLMLLKSQRLSIEGLLHLLFLGVQIGEPRVTLLPSTIACRFGQLVAEQV